MKKKKNIYKLILIISLSANILVLCFSMGFIYKRGGVKYIKSIAIKHTSTATEVRSDIFKMSPIVEGKIIMLGDSITNYCEWAEILNNQNIINRGIGGDTTLQILERIDDIIIRKPSKIFILVGINDLKDGISVEESIENYEKIINKLKDNLPNTELYIESLLPCNNEMYAFSPRVEDIILYNDNLKKISENKGCTYINLYDSFVNDNQQLKSELTYDGLHPNSNGYKIFQSILSEYIK